jgi:hypothetical protein
MKREAMMSEFKADGVWIFVSHSNLDFERAREIRDALENDGHKPLLFFLKCLQKDDARLPQLIRDEIATRTWFILCDSDNSKVSPWVPEEVEIVKSTKPKETFVAIDLEKDLRVTDGDDAPPFLHKLRPLLKRATVFMSYARADAAVARQIYDALVEQDYRAFLDIRSLTAGINWQTAVQSAIEDAAEHGFVLLLLSPEYLTSRACENERLLAFEAVRSKRKSNIVPVIVRDPNGVYRQLPPDLQALQCEDMTKGSIAQNITALLHHLKSRPMA